MDWLQTLLDNSTTPLLTAFLLGLLTALSPCPLATNIAAIGFIGKDIENRRQIFRNGLLYTLGRIVAYTLLGTILITVLKEGSSMFGIQKTIGTYGEWLLGPLLLLIGLFMLFGSRLNLPQFGFSGNAEGLAQKGGWGALLIGILFALAFCPTSGVFYFGMLIPIINISLEEAWRNSESDKKEMIFTSYGIDKNEHSDLFNRRIILLTQPLWPDFISQDEHARIYKEILSNYKTCDIVIKTHPRDLFDYKSLDMDLYVLDKPIPVQLLTMLGVRYDRAVTVFSTAVYTFKELGAVIDWYGTEISDALFFALGHKSM